MPKIEPGPPEYCNILVVSDWEIVIPLNSTVSIVLSCFTLYKVTNLLESELFKDDKLVPKLTFLVLTVGPPTTSVYLRKDPLESIDSGDKVRDIFKRVFGYA